MYMCKWFNVLINYCASIVTDCSGDIWERDGVLAGGVSGVWGRGFVEGGCGR